MEEQEVDQRMRLSLFCEVLTRWGRRSGVEAVPLITPGLGRPRLTSVCGREG